MIIQDLFGNIEYKTEFSDDCIINKFIVDNQNKIITFEKFVETITNQNKIHNHTIENLFLYFDLRDSILKNRVVFFENVVLFVSNRKHKLFVFDEPQFSTKYNLDAFQNANDYSSKIIIYSSQEFEQSDLFVKSKLKECVYNLNEIFDEKTYFEKYQDLSVKKIKKKIYNRIVYPFRYLNSQKFKCEEITIENFSKVKFVHDLWVKHKLNDEKTFKIMFSSKRYIHCVKEILNDAFLKERKFYAKLFYWENKPIAVRLCMLDIKNQTSYDIAFFSLFFECPSNLILYINAFCLREMKEKHGILQHNCGMEMSKLLKVSKEHFPSNHKTTYKYNLKK